MSGDTVVVYGPRQLAGSNGHGQTYVERFTVTSPGGRLYTLHLVNGNASGGQRASKVTVTLNGLQVVAQNEVTQAVGVLDRPVAITDVDTIRATVAGSGSPTAAPPFRVFVVNGTTTGTKRVTSGSITLNGTQVVSTSELTRAVRALTKTVTLTASNRRDGTTAYIFVATGNLRLVAVPIVTRSST